MSKVRGSVFPDSFGFEVLSKKKLKRTYLEGAEGLDEEHATKDI